MKIVAINGSPRKKGNTAFALDLLCREFRNAGFDAEIIHVGNKQIHGCIACNKCIENKNEQCIIHTDEVNEWLRILKDADAILLGSPVYFAGIAGSMKCFLDRAFYVASANGGWFDGKVGASVVSLRRGGASAAFDGLNHYLLMSNMIVPASSYWNMVHGFQPGKAVSDGEGLQILENLAQNIIWILRMQDATQDTIPRPTRPQRILTNFIR